MSNTYSKLEYDRILLELDNCREDVGDVSELAKDIEQNGLIHPLLVWERKQKNTRKFVLTAGFRRHAAITLIRKKDPTAFAKVPVVVFRGNEDDAYFKQISENLERKNLTPTELADAVQKMSHRGHSQREIAKRLSKTPSWVSKILSMRQNCSSQVLRALGDGQITQTQAQELSKKPEAKQNTTLAKFLDLSASVGPRKARAETADKPKRPTASEIQKHIERVDLGGSCGSDYVIQTLRWVLGERDSLPL